MDSLRARNPGRSPTMRIIRKPLINHKACCYVTLELRRDVNICILGFIDMDLFLENLHRFDFVNAKFIRHVVSKVSTLLKKACTQLLKQSVHHSSSTVRGNSNKATAISGIAISHSLWAAHSWIVHISFLIL